MKRISTFIIKSLIAVAPFTSIAQVPTTAWAKNFGNSSDNDQGRSITADASGNTYHTGIFNNTATFGNFSLTSNGYDNMFIVKRDINGDVVWVARSSKSTYVLDIAVDGSGNVYTTGYFSQSSSAPNTLGTFTMSNIGYEDGFIAKCDANGNFLWAQNFGGTNFDAGNALTVDASGNVYVTGQFNSTLSIGTFTFNSGWANRDAFLAKYDPSGNVIWAKTYGGTGVDEGLEIVTDPAGNIYSVGTFSNTAAFDTYSLTSTAISGKRNVYVAKTDASGNSVWASKIDVNSGDYYYDNYDYGIAVDGSGNAYVTGTFKGVANFGTYSVTTNSGNSSDVDIFLTKLDVNGSINWVKQYGWNFNDRGTSIVCDAAGDVYSTGIFEGAVTFGTNNFTGGGAYVMKHNATGSMQWVKQIGNYSYEPSIAINTNSELFLTGNFKKEIVLDNGTLNSFSSGWFDTDGFVLKLNSSSTIGVKENELESSTRIMPNPATGFINVCIDKQKVSNYTASLIDIFGKTIASINMIGSNITFSLEGLSAGIYYIKLNDNAGNETIKKIVKL